MKNQELAEIFYQIADILELLGVEWKPQAYRKAASFLESLTTPIEDIYKKNGLKGLDKLPGIGKSTHTLRRHLHLPIKEKRPDEKI